MRATTVIRGGVLLGVAAGMLGGASSCASHPPNHTPVTSPAPPGPAPGPPRVPADALVTLLRKSATGPFEISRHMKRLPGPYPVGTRPTSTLLWPGRFEDTAEVSRLLGAGCDVNARDDRQDTALLYAAAHASDAVVFQLLEAGADVNAADVAGETALMIAADKRRPAVVKRLLERNARVDVYSRYGESVLYKACGDKRVVTLLLRHGARVDAYALTGTCYVDRVAPAVIGMMLDTGIPVETRDRQGRTPLMCAAYSDNVPLLREVLRRGANPRVRDNGGLSAFAYASCATLPKNRRVIALLRAAASR